MAGVATVVVVISAVAVVKVVEVLFGAVTQCSSRSPCSCDVVYICSFCSYC